MREHGSASKLVRITGRFRQLVARWLPWAAAREGFKNRPWQGWKKILSSNASSGIAREKKE
eukprot:scaffold56821_cov18-Prasinocladus_malaysianus.AAC.1